VLVFLPVFFLLGLCWSVPALAQSKYALNINFIDKDSAFRSDDLALTRYFDNQQLAEVYIQKLPATLASKGFPVASIDSVRFTDTCADLQVYLGSAFQFGKISFDRLDAALQSNKLLNGIKNKSFISIKEWELIQNELLHYYENNGYPFASIYMDSIHFDGSAISGVLAIEKGLYYTIDSISIKGNTQIKNRFLQHYLGILNGSAYNKSLISQVDKKLSALAYLTVLQPSDVLLLGTGAVMQVYANNKKNNQLNFLLGLQPSATKSGAVQLTGDVNVDLKNQFNNGESILFKWQQLQPKSPRLNIGFNQPYILKSAFGFDMAFEMFKKDSTFLVLNTQLGTLFDLPNNQKGKLYFQWQSTTLLSGAIDSNKIKIEKKLPIQIDMNTQSLGFQYQWNNFDYAYNPQRGNTVSINVSAGIKQVKTNDVITGIANNGFNYASLYDSIALKTYQFRLKFIGSHHFPIGKFSTFKVGLQLGYYNSTSIFRNELFDIILMIIR
jgi:outer membrane protein assembly factor BamA